MKDLIGSPSPSSDGSRAGGSVCRRPYAIRVLTLLLLGASAARAMAAYATEPPSIGTVLDSVQAQSARCLPLWKDMTYLGTIREGKNTRMERIVVVNGSVSSTLVAVWKDRKPISAKNLKKEQAEYEKTMRKMQESPSETPGEFDPSRMMMPAAAGIEMFRSENVASYRFSNVTSGAFHAEDAWKFDFVPTVESKSLVGGTAWVRPKTCELLGITLQPPKGGLPLTMKLVFKSQEIAYTSSSRGCITPRSVRAEWLIRGFLLGGGHGETELTYDSVQFTSKWPEVAMDDPRQIGQRLTGYPADAKVRIAVMHLESGSLTESTAGIVELLLRESLWKSGRFEVLERTRVDDVIAELGFQQSGCTENQCAAQVGKALNAQEMVLGSVEKLGDLFIVAIRFVNVEKASVSLAESARCRCQIEDLPAAIEELAAKVKNGI